MNINPKVRGMLLVILALISQHLFAAVGRVAGELTVDNGGQSNYRIPLVVPAGANDQAPNLALAYKSSDGYGLAGHGWSVDGLSVISRCVGTRATYGEFNAVEYNDGDKLCLDGIPLLRESGSQLKGGSKYRKESHAYEVIEAHGSSSATAASFTVKLASGIIMRYGNDADSRIAAPGLSVTRIWALNEIEDTVGNKIVFQYQSFGGGSEYVPTEVRWSVNGLTQGRYKLVFEYDAVSISADDRSGYVYGSLWKRTKRLKTIRYQYSEGSAFNDVHTYALNYTQQAANDTGTGRSQLASVEQCSFVSGVKNCLPATVFGWLSGTSGWQSPQQVSGSTENFNNSRVGDFDGDGLADVYTAKNGTWHILKGQPNGTFTEIDTGKSAATPDETYILDYNGDGLLDLFTPDPAGANWSVYQSNGIGFDTVATNIPKTVGGQSYTRCCIFGDSNGDGLADLFWQTTYLSTSLYMQTNNGAGFDAPVNIFSLGQGIDFDFSTTADWNGDGLDDLLIFRPYQFGQVTFADIYYLVASPSGFVQIGSDSWQVAATSGSPEMRAPIVLDLNGDGLSDVLFSHMYGDDITWQARLSTGASMQSAVSTGVIADPRAKSTDYDSDGRSDLAQFAGSSITVYEWTGSDLDLASSFYSDSGDFLVSADFTGDSLQDLLYVHNNSWHMRRHLGVKPDVIETVQDGFGNLTTFTYESLARTSAYSVNAVSDAPEVLMARDTRYVVTKYEASDGVGGTYEKDFEYSDGRINKWGRGFLGFGKVGSVDSRIGLRVSTEFRHEHPYTGRLKEKSIQQPVGNDNFIYTQQYNYDNYQNPSAIEKANFVYLNNTTQWDYELEGTLIRKAVTNRVSPGYPFDFVHGRPSRVSTKITSSAVGWTGREWTLTKDYDYDDGAQKIAANCLGLPLSVVETRVDDTSASETRHSASTFNNQCLETSRTVGGNLYDPGEDKLRVQTFYVDGRVDYTVTNNAIGSLAERRVEYGWDSIGYRISSLKTILANGDDPQVNISWDYRFGQQANVTNPRGLTDVWKYDDFGRLESVVADGAPSVTISIQFCTSCEFLNAVYKVISARTDGSEVQTWYDSYGRKVGVRQRMGDGRFSRKQIEYTHNGQVYREDIPRMEGDPPFYVSYNYDVLGRRILMSKSSHDEAGSHVNPPEIAGDLLS